MELHQFKFNGPELNGILGQILVMKNSCWLWMSRELESGKYELGPLAAGMVSKLDGQPVSTVLQSSGGTEDDVSASMSARLAKKFGIQCYVSSDIDEASVPAAMKQLDTVMRTYFET